MKEYIADPRVSIVIPVYNGSNYLRRSIECALAQTYANTEVIVVNDGSTDDGATAAIALSYGDRIRYIEKENGGVSTALNRGIAEMTGEFFSWLSHDDEYSPTKVEDSIAALRKAGRLDGTAIAYTGHNHINKDSEVLKEFPDEFETDRFYSAQEMVRYCAPHQTLNGCCMLIPTDALRNTGGFDENLRYSQDALMWFRLFFGGLGLVFDGKVNVGYRLHSTQTSRTRHDLFDRDMTAIAKEISYDLCTGSDGARTAFLYAKRLSCYGVRHAVAVVKETAASCGTPFSVWQRFQMRTLLFYSRFRSGLKRIYYRFFLKAKV